MDPGEAMVDPGEAMVDPGEVMVDPGEVMVDPGEVMVDPGEAMVDPGEVNTGEVEEQVQLESHKRKTSGKICLKDKKKQACGGCPAVPLTR